MILQPKLSLNTEKSIRFKASFSPCLIIEMLGNDINLIENELTDMVNRTPKFFVGSPVIIDLENGADKAMDFHRLKQLFISAGMIPVGIRNGDGEQQAAALLAELPIVKVGKASAAETASMQSPPKTSSAKLLPRRYGQVYKFLL
jgi:septum site-determining protein MinC